MRLLCVLMTQGSVYGDLSPATQGTKSGLHEGSAHMENKRTQFLRPYWGEDSFPAMVPGRDED